VSGPPLRSRVLTGALAGVVGTAAMTAVMNRLHRRLPAGERYPLPPREITQTLLPTPDEEAAKDQSITAHLAFGSAAAALLAASTPRPGMGRGVSAGLLVWLGSYFGWVPAGGILKPVHRHPVRRTALMIAAHVVWGAVTALTARELDDSRHSVFKRGKLRDRPAASTDD
jgi:uncharacterized membrane protein YagU involved in acid resistance